MDINLRNAAPRLFPDSNFEMVYFEAISNALDAGANKIDIEIEYSNSNFNKFIITDNGAGFNDEHYYRFSELMETKDNAHKGQGRVVYLLYFENIEITSRFNENSKLQQRHFHFNHEFTKDNANLTNCETETNVSTGTRLAFSGKATRKMRSLDTLRANNIRQQIFSEFLPCLFQMKRENKEFQINIKSKVNNKDELNASINLQDIPEFTEIELDTSELVAKNSNQDLLKNTKSHLYYFLREDKEDSSISSIVTSFAIDNRAKHIDIVDKPNYLPNVEAIFLLSSTHFEGCVDPTRQELALKPEELKKIKKIFRKYVRNILKEYFSEYQNIIQSRKDFLIDKFPHLMDYIDIEEIGFKSNQDVIKDAQDKFFLEQRKILEKETLNEEDYVKAIDLSSKNLAEYILFRQLQI